MKNSRNRPRRENGRKVTTMKKRESRVTQLQLAEIQQLQSDLAHLRGQGEPRTDLFVEKPVHWKLPKLFLVPSQLRQTAGGTVRQFKRFTQRLGLLRRRQKFYLNSQLHTVKIFKGLNMSNELRRNSHSVSKLVVHLVFVVKYRRAVITDTVWKSLQYGFGLAATRLELVLVETNHDKDHAHLVVEYPPSVSVSELVAALKGNSSFVARRDCAEELRKNLWGDAFWTPSFFSASCGGAPIEILKLYVQSQQTKPESRPKGSGFQPKKS